MSISAAINRREFVSISAATGAALSSPARASKIDLPAANRTNIKLTVNGQSQSLAVDNRTTLLDLLRDRLQLTGTKKGCDHGQCGACTVLVNGRRMNSCLTLAVMHDGDAVTSVEGIAQGNHLHPVQAAFVQHDGFQCGYCTPGQICSAVALLDEWRQGGASAVTPTHATGSAIKLTAEEIRERMSGNLCRCGAYAGIVAAVEAASRQTERSS